MKICETFLPTIIKRAPSNCSMQTRRTGGQGRGLAARARNTAASKLAEPESGAVDVESTPLPLSLFRILLLFDGAAAASSLNLPQPSSTSSSKPPLPPTLTNVLLFYFCVLFCCCVVSPSSFLIRWWPSRPVVVVIGYRHCCRGRCLRRCRRRRRRLSRSHRHLPNPSL